MKRKLRKRYGKSGAPIFSIRTGQLVPGITTRPDAFGEIAVYSYGEMIGHVKGNAWRATHRAYGGRWHKVVGSESAALRALVLTTTGREIPR